MKPRTDGSLTEHTYLEACSRAGKITSEQIRDQLCKLKPYKALGPDGILNIVLTRCTDLIIKRLLFIYQAMLNENLMFKPWKESTTVVIRKPGKSNYSTPKAYRPIALLNTIWKVIMAIVANHILYYTEKHQLLPTNHFGRRPGRTTTDIIHLLTNSIKAAWRKQRVVSILFLDIEGAFSNINLERLVHNLQKCKVPDKYTNCVQGMLDEWATVLKFDGFASEKTPIDNGIRQKDLLSMILYQYYNANLLNIPEQQEEEAVAYVDNAFMLATGDNFQDAHKKLKDMMCKERGVENWSETHSSPLKYSKLTLINFAHRQNNTESPALQLPHKTIVPSKSIKYLGVIVNRNLTWKAQQSYAVEKGTKWAAQI